MNSLCSRLYFLLIATQLTSVLIYLFLDFRYIFFLRLMVIEDPEPKLLEMEESIECQILDQTANISSK